MKKKLLFVAALMTAATAGMQGVQAKISCYTAQLVDLQGGVTATSEEKQRPENDNTDVTEWIVNPRFDSGVVNGWNDSDKIGFYGYADTDVERAAEIFSKEFNLYQNIAGMPNGLYTITVQAAANRGGRLYFYADADVHTEVGVSDGIGASLVSIGADWAENRDHNRMKLENVLVIDGKLRIGLTWRGFVNGSWAVFDDFQLLYVNDGQAQIDEKNVALKTEIQNLIDSNEYPTALTDRFSTDCVLPETPAIDECYAYYHSMVAFKNMLSAEAKDLKRMQDFCTRQGLTDAVAASNSSLATVKDNAGVITIRETLSTAMNAAISENGAVIEFTDFTTAPANWTGGASIREGVAEFFNTNFDYWKQCTGLPSGWYQVEVNALYVPSSSTFSLWKDMLVRNMAVVFGDNGGFAARYSVPVLCRYEEDCSNLGTMGDEGKFPADVWQAGSTFSAGKYKTVVNVYVNEQGILNYGLAGTKEGSPANWICFDNFKVTYRGTNLSVMWDAMKAEAKTQAAKVSDDYASEVDGWEKPATIDEAAIWQLNEKTKEIVTVANKVAEVGAQLNSISFEDLLAHSEAAAADVAALNNAVPNAHQTRKNHIKSVAEADALLTQVENIRRDYMKAANPVGDYTFDMTFLLTNPSTYAYPVGPVEGWFCDVDRNNFRNASDSKRAGTEVTPVVWEFMEVWKNSMIEQKDGNGWLLYQQTALPVGSYSLKAATFTANPGNAGTVGAPSAQLSMGKGDVVLKKGESVDTETLSWTNLDFEISEATTAENPTKLGVWLNADNQAAWFGVQYMTLTKVAPKNLSLSETSKEAPVAEDTYANVTLERTLSADKWNTFCVPFDMPADKFADVRELTGCTIDSEGNSATLTFDEPKEGIKAGRPYIVKANEGLTSLEVGPVVVKSAAPEPLELAGVIMQGNYTQMYVPLDAYFIRNNMFYVADVENYVNMNGFRAYIQLQGSENPVNRMFIDIDGDVTAIENVLDDAVTDADKTVDVYTVAGVRVKNGVKKADALAGLNKGIYIVDGKKVVK